MKKNIAISKKILEIIKELNISQENFGKQINLSREYVNKIINGKAPISDRIKMDITLNYNINPEYWIVENSPMFYTKEVEEELDKKMDSLRNLMLGIRGKPQAKILVEMILKIPESEYNFIYDSLKYILSKSSGNKNKD